MNQEYIDSLREALVFSPENASLRKILADGLFNLANYEAAMEEYKALLAINSADFWAKVQLAHCYFKLKNYTTAQVVAEDAYDQETESPGLNFLLSKISLEIGAIKQAKAYFDKAIALDVFIGDRDYEQYLNKKIKESGLAFESNFEDDFEDIFGAEDNGSMEKPDISFKDVGGMQAIKDEIALKVIHPLNHPEIYKAYGKSIGGGILLYGPPGCGKTMLARATAGEINAGFIAVSINDILDMWIGNSENNLHDIFEEARLNTPCVLFFDEIDALGASRNDMRKAAGRFLINQFLDELDGVKYSNEGILVLGATNCPWYLDTAFRRPGRFDRIIFVSPPDITARQEILQLLTENKPVENLDIAQLAKLSPEFSGADLKAVLDIAIEAKLPESLKQGRVLPIGNNDIKQAIAKHQATTKEWFATAKNYALYSNESGLYDDILKYLNIKK
jgi:transitional endoplasmic reticulum ATPase